MPEGGCLCGALRYRVSADPVDTGYCHCSLCRRSTGAPVLAFASFPVDSFTYVDAEPAIYNSSGRGHREFCSTCGTQICYRDSGAAVTVDVNVGSLDDPQAHPPRCHIHASDRILWFDSADDLPRHEHADPS
jgi:hypothetical protein